jgi:hypothetical protein
MTVIRECRESQPFRPELSDEIVWDPVTRIINLTLNRGEDERTRCYMSHFRILKVTVFFNSHSGGGVLLGLLGTSAPDWPIVPALGDYDDGEFGGMKIGKGNRSTRRKLVPAPLVHHKSHLTRRGIEPGPPRWETSD